MVNTVICSKDDLRETRRKWAEKLDQIDMTELKVVRTFAKGSFAHVSLVQLDDHPNTAFALKAIQKDKIKKKRDRRNIFSEKDILYAVQSDFVVKLYRTFKDKKFLYFLTEYCPGGNFRNILHHQRRFSEDVARFYMACTIEAIDCVHSMHIVHNDIKPANLVLDSQGYAKLIDFGLAEKLEPGALMSALSGTIHFMSPEVVWPPFREHLGGLDRAKDLWALGVLMYKFLSGLHPFKREFDNGNQIRNNITKGITSVNFSEDYFSKEAINLVRKLCSFFPKKRIGYEGIQEIKNHPWFEKFDWTGLHNRELKPPTIPYIESTFDTKNCKKIVRIDVDAVAENDSDWDIDF